jgi:hypothetical protein
MMVALPKAIMSLAMCCLGKSRREWALAMRGEFEAAVAEGKPLAFAAGCLFAAWREMPTHREGRVALASHALALGLLVPMAALQFLCAVGFPPSAPGSDLIYAMISAGRAPDPYLVSAQQSALPALLFLRLLLGVGQVWLAWVLLERDWTRAFNIGALIAAVTVTLFLFTEILLLDGTMLIRQSVILAIELAAVLAAARCDAQLVPSAVWEKPA